MDFNTKEFSIPSMLNKKKIELSYMIHLKFNLMEGVIGSLTPKFNIHLMAYKKKTESEDVYRQKS
jgi:hypothetical protein